MGIRDLINKFNEHHIHQQQQHQQNTTNQPPPIPTRNYKREPESIPKQAHVQTPLINNSDDIFSKPIAQGPPPPLFKSIKHTQLPAGCSFSPSDPPIQTNNFSNNLTLEDQTFPIWTLPYSFWLTKDPGQDFGFAFNHTEANQRVFGPDPGAPVAQFYFNPPRIKSFVFSSSNFQNGVNLTLENHRKLSITAKLHDSRGNGVITIPLVYGMGIIYANYENITPVLASQVGFQDFKPVNGGSVFKAIVKLFNQVEWTIYSNIQLRMVDNNHIIGDSPGWIKIARGTSQTYDMADINSYVESADISAIVKNDICQYKIKYNINGGGKSIIYALPHHQETIINVEPTGLSLDSPTKGLMKGYLTDELVMEEKLPVDILFEPWSESKQQVTYTQVQKEKIRQAATEEVKQDVVGMANIDSMYTSGKILDKFAYIAYVCHFILQDQQLTNIILPKVKTAIEIFANNMQIFPLVYDTVWKGLISSADPGADFGNSNYNDHHFHYGYHIHAIALVAKIDPNWLHANNDIVFNYANTLLRDVASPQADASFPQFRSFDWFHGHSFAHGIFASGDGKDEESSSEDYHFVYGMKLYANVIGDFQMESRADLMLAIMKRSMNMYMLYTNDNKIQPKQFIPNKVAGISFENKIDYATYFGRGSIGDEWIHGIHMIPLTPVSSYMRSKKFVKEEWDEKLAGIIDRIPDGWKGLLILNYAIYDPKYSWNWFSRKDWDPSLIDNGMSRTWSLALIAGIL
ncbi:unnamed protein product [Candida verbasci]|uniref:glucan endo-1,3-beta-D-glucosidase n=1 Tax=Candida verbasci TaxID=1227364 RepID=A0A9W4XCI7_9ASCO|nr:unnamed protein product [Candida verbasci]